MNRFFGAVGYVETVETKPSVWTKKVTEIPYRGDVQRNMRRMTDGENVNEDISANHSISIVADAYAFDHFSAIRYVKWMGACWKVTNIEVQRPRLILTIGGLYHNGDKS